MHATSHAPNALHGWSYSRFPDVETFSQTGKALFPLFSLHSIVPEHISPICV